MVGHLLSVSKLLSYTLSKDEGGERGEEGEKGKEEEGSNPHSGRIR